MLSMMRMIQLVNFIIRRFFGYSFITYKWSIALLKELDRWIQNLIWTWDSTSRGLVTAKWNVLLCYPKVRGAFGVISLRGENQASSLRIAW